MQGGVSGDKWCRCFVGQKPKKGSVKAKVTECEGPQIYSIDTNTGIGIRSIQA